MKKELDKNEFVRKKLTPRSWKQTDSRKWYVVRDVVNSEVLFSEALVDLLLERHDDSERFIPFLKTLIENPYEKWLTEMLGATGEVRLVQTYIGLYHGQEPGQHYTLILKCDQMEDRWVISDLFPVSDEMVNEFRVGNLMYGRPE